MLTRRKLFGWIATATGVAIAGTATPTPTANASLEASLKAMVDAEMFRNYPGSLYRRASDNDRDTREAREAMKVATEL
jgi:hypothetical protein